MKSAPISKAMRKIDQRVLNKWSKLSEQKLRIFQKLFARPNITFNANWSLI